MVASVLDRNIEHSLAKKAYALQATKFIVTYQTHQSKLAVVDWWVLLPDCYTPAL